MKKFLFSVADAYFYKSNSNDLIFQSKTLVDTSIEATISNEDQVKVILYSSFIITLPN